MPKEVHGQLSSRGMRVAVVAGRFNGFIVDQLVRGVVDAVVRTGGREEDVVVHWVPGAFEIPLVARRFAVSGAFDAVICLGAVVRGETAHYDLIATETARGVAEVARETGVPVIFEVLVADRLDLVEARAGGSRGNRGRDAAEAALEMVDLLRRLPAGDRAEALR